MTAVKAFREPATVLAMVVVLVGVAITAARVASGLQSAPLTVVLTDLSGLYGIVDALVLTALALSCALTGPQTRHASALTAGASFLVWLGAGAGGVLVVVALVVGAGGSMARVLEIVGGLTDVALRALMGYVLVLGHRVAVAGDSQGGPPAPRPVAADEVQAPAAQSQPATQPSWEPDVAAGVVWRSAADAASGAAAGTYGAGGTGWAVPSEPSGLPGLRELPPESERSGTDS